MRVKILPLLLQSVMVTADVAKLVDALDLGSSAARHGGSSPSIRTTLNPQWRYKNNEIEGFIINCTFKHNSSWTFS